MLHRMKLFLRICKKHSQFCWTFENFCVLYELEVKIMKRALSMLLCIALLLSITGCRNTEEQTTTTQSNVTVTESTTEPETVEKATESTTEPTEESTKPKSEEITSGQNADSKETTTVKSLKPKPTNTTTTTIPQETETGTTNPVQYATEADEKAIAERLVYYINEYRKEQGAPVAIKLLGLTKYAEYRSRQLISNFAHDTEDERTAATALKYGEYVDPSLYGMSGEPYYTANAGEAIAKAGYVGTVDEIAKKFATLTRNSLGHWAYVGDSRYKYIGIGITYESGVWYCDIAVAMENSDNL